MLPRPPRRGLVPWRTLRKLQISGFRNQVVSERRELASRLSMFSRLCRVRCGQGFLNASSGLLGAGLPRLAATNFSRPKPVFESRSRFRQVSYAVTDQQYPATSTRLKHAAERSLKHPEHDHVKREPGRPYPTNENYKTISGRAPSSSVKRLIIGIRFFSARLVISARWPQDQRRRQRDESLRPLATRPVHSVLLIAPTLDVQQEHRHSRGAGGGLG